MKIDPQPRTDLPADRRRDSRRRRGWRVSPRRLRCPRSARWPSKSRSIRTPCSAYDELEREGLIYSQRGKGLFVTERGTASAQAGAENGVRQAFDGAVHASLAAGMSARQIRATSSAVLEDSRRAPADQPPACPTIPEQGANDHDNANRQRSGDCAPRSDEAIRQHDRRQRPFPDGPPRHDLWAVGPERGRQEHDHQDAGGYVDAHIRRGPGAGRNVRENPTQMKQRIGYVPETHHIYRWMRVKEAIGFCRACYRTWNDAVCREMLSLFDLDANKKVKQLSKGMQVKLSLLLAISHEPEFAPVGRAPFRSGPSGPRGILGRRAAGGMRPGANRGDLQPHAR